MRCWALYVRHGFGRDSAIQRGIEHVACWFATAVQGELSHGNSVQVNFFQNFQTWTCLDIPIAKLAESFAIHAARRLSFGMQEVRVSRAFMVNSQHGSVGGRGAVAAVAVDVENVHAVVVITNAHAPVICFQT